MIRLVGLDFDGTLVENGLDGPVASPRTMARLDDLVRGGVIAGIVTGNGWWTTRRQLERAGAGWAGRFPSFVISRESFIHWKSPDGTLHADAEWNRARSLEYGRLVGWLAELHYELYAEMTDAGFRITDFRLLGDYGLEAYFDTEEEAEEARGWLAERVRDQPLARAHRNRTNANIVLATGGKGASLLRAARTRNIEPRDVLAIGDGLNDLDMLDGTLGMLCATTGNAAQCVKDAVRAADGFIASKHSTWGLEEVFDNFSFGC